MILGASAHEWFLLGPEAGRIGKLVEAEGVDRPEVREQIERILMISPVGLALIVLAVVDSTLRPVS